MLVSISEAIIIFLVLTREDQRGLHDLLFNTKVISIEEPKENTVKEIQSKNANNNKIIEADYKEKGSKDGKRKK